MPAPASAAGWSPIIVWCLSFGAIAIGPVQSACRTKQLSEPQSWCQLPSSTDHCQYMANTRLAGHWTHDTAFLLLDQTGSWRMCRGEARASSILTRLSIFSPRPRVLVLMTESRISGAKWGETCHHGHQMSPWHAPHWQEAHHMEVQIFSVSMFVSLRHLPPIVCWSLHSNFILIQLPFVSTYWFYLIVDCPNYPRPAITEFNERIMWCCDSCGTPVLCRLAHVFTVSWETGNILSTMHTQHLQHTLTPICR